MPELPDVALYVEALQRKTRGRRLTGIRLVSPFLLRTVEPSVEQVVGREVRAVTRLGKRVVFELEGEVFAVIHLMIAGRFKWAPEGAKVPSRVGLACFDFESGTLILREASKKKRASLHLVRGRGGLKDHDRGGVEPLETDLAGFVAAITRERHTLKRALTDRSLSRLLKKSWPKTLEELEGG